MTGTDHLLHAAVDPNSTFFYISLTAKTVFSQISLKVNSVSGAALEADSAL